MNVNQKIIKEWRDFSAAQLHENGMLTEQLEFTVRVAQEWQARAEAAERRVAELEVQLATMTIIAIDGIGYYVLPGPGVSTSPSLPPPAATESREE